MSKHESNDAIQIERLQEENDRLRVVLQNIRDFANTDQYHASLALRRVHEMALIALQED